MNNFKLKLLVAASLLPFAVEAQTVPAIDKTASVSPAVQLPQTRIRISEKERHALNLAAQWKNNPDKPRKAEDGSVKYLFGATLPSLICTPLQVCAIQLQAGEVVNDVHAGDSARWKLTPSMMGDGDNAITWIVVKPTESGLTTNLFITTNRRHYIIELKSARNEWMPVLSFDYPEDSEKAWASYMSKVGRAKEASTLSTGESIHDLDFNYRLSGDNPKWKPVRVYRKYYGDEVKTVIEFASTNFGNDAPALVALGKDGGLFSEAETQIVNYRPIGNRYEVDSALDRALLISGVGSNQTKVTIEYVGRE